MTGGAGEGWRDVDALNQERGDKQLAGLHGMIYALGGESKVGVLVVPESELPGLGARSEVLDTVEVYDPRGPGVHAVAAVPVQRQRVARQGGGGRRGVHLRVWGSGRIRRGLQVLPHHRQGTRV